MELREDTGAGGVTFAATPAESAYLAAQGQPADRWGFLVQLDTHSVDLTDLDLLSLTILRDGRGREFRPIVWQGLDEGAHHRSGLLIFSSRDTDGQLTPAQGGGYLELVLKDVAGVKERVLRWD